jgi:hypothetical protein
MNCRFCGQYIPDHTTAMIEHDCPALKQTDGDRIIAESRGHNEHLHAEIADLRARLAESESDKSVFLRRAIDLAKAIQNARHKIHCGKIDEADKCLRDAILNQGKEVEADE